MARRRAITGLLFVAPAALYFLVFWIYPMLRAVYISLTDWYLLSEPHFIGFGNYARLFSDYQARQALQATGYYAVGSTLSIFAISLTLALLLNGRLRGRGFFTTVLYLPAVVSWVSAATVWLLIFMPNVGLYRILLGPLMRLLDVGQIRWLDSKIWAMPSVIMVAVWKNFGANVVLFLAGLQAMPEEVHEAARVDGANALQTVFRITLPLLRPTMLFVLVMLVIGGFQVFAPIYVMTRGGPGGTTRVLPMYLYEEAFASYHMGFASAVSMAMLVVLLGLTVAQVRILGTEGAYD